MKRCTHCGKEKDESLFYKDSRVKSGVTATCKKCANEISNRWHKAHPERQAKSARAYYYRKRRKEGKPIRKPFEELGKTKTCVIIHKHHEEMKNDPEHLSTEFIQKLVGRKC
jgi:hypothetical protein